MPFKVTDLAFQISLDDQRIDFTVIDLPNKKFIAQGGAATCGPTNQRGPCVVAYQIGFEDRSNFDKLREALSAFLVEMNSIEISEGE